MTNRLVLYLIFLSISVPLALAQNGMNGEATPEQLVARLGSRGNDDSKDVKQLATTPKASVRLLIDALHTIPDSEGFAKADGTSMEHVLWIIRGLRYVTGGIDFCSKTNHVFGNSEEEKNRKYWLTFHHNDCLTFFGYWMSRDRTYIAPPDTQKNIISQWQHWYSAYGTSFEYKPLQNPPPEKWIW